MGDLDDFEIDDTACKLIAGFRPLDIFAVEANYMDLGDEARIIGGRAVSTQKPRRSRAYAIGFLPARPRRPLCQGRPGPLGDGRPRDAGTLASDFDDDGTEFAYGAGVQVQLRQPRRPARVRAVRRRQHRRAWSC